MERVKTPAASGNVVSIVVALADGRHMTLTELQSASGMSFADFAEALKGLQKATF
jgi:hypothetical protein